MSRFAPAVLAVRSRLLEPDMGSGSFVRVFLFLSLLAVLGGCATLLHGTTQEIPVTSDPEGAEVSVGAFRGRTPTVVELKRGESHAVRISLEGYKTEVIAVGKIMAPAASGTNPFQSVQTGTVAGQAGGLAASGPVAGAPHRGASRPPRAGRLTACARRDGPRLVAPDVLADVALDRRGRAAAAGRKASSATFATAAAARMEDSTLHPDHKNTVSPGGDGWALET